MTQNDDFNDCICIWPTQAFRSPGEVPQCKSWSQVSVHTRQGLEVLRETLSAAEELLKTQIYTVTKRGYLFCHLTALKQSKELQMKVTYYCDGIFISFSTELEAISEYAGIQI